MSRQVISWFQSDFNVISGLNNQQYSSYSKLFFHKKEQSSVDALKFFQKLRLGFNSILTHDIPTTRRFIGKCIANSLP